MCLDSERGSRSPYTVLEFPDKQEEGGITLDTHSEYWSRRSRHAHNLLLVIKNTAYTFFFTHAKNVSTLDLTININILLSLQATHTLSPFVFIWRSNYMYELNGRKKTGWFIVLNWSRPWFYYWFKLWLLRLCRLASIKHSAVLWFLLNFS